MHPHFIQASQFFQFNPGCFETPKEYINNNGENYKKNEQNILDKNSPNEAFNNVNFPRQSSLGVNNFQDFYNYKNIYQQQNFKNNNNYSSDNRINHHNSKTYKNNRTNKPYPYPYSSCSNRNHPDINNFSQFSNYNSSNIGNNIVIENNS